MLPLLLLLTFLALVDAQNCAPDPECVSTGSVLSCAFLNLPLGPCSLPPGTTQLWLDFNQITSFVQDSFADPSYQTLNYLSVSTNLLPSLAANTFTHMPNLTTMSLAGNLITELVDNTFLGLANLQYLDLEWNLITTISQNAFLGLTALHTLILGGNTLTTLPSNGFQGLSGLFSLTLSDNPIILIQKDAFVATPLLQQLSLELIGPVSLAPSSFSSLPHAKINMRASTITTLDSTSFLGAFPTFICGQTSTDTHLCNVTACSSSCGQNSTCYLDSFVFPDSTFTCCIEGTPCPPPLKGISSSLRFIIIMISAIVGLWVLVIIVMLVQYFKKKQSIKRQSRSNSERAPLLK